MIMPSLPARISAAVLIDLLIVALAFPVAFVLTHGLAPGGWPAGQTSPLTWIGWFLDGEIVKIGNFLLDFLRGRVDALPMVGAIAGYTTVFLVMVVPAVIVAFGERVPLRDASKRYGDARWAAPDVLRTMTRGLELGLEPKSKRAVRVLVEGNLVTIAPPRSGKTGLILANLALPEVGAWNGPAVVIDPKGAAYLAMRERREALGRTVRCIDPLGLVGGTDRWNPLLHVDWTDITSLTSMARALLPEPKNADEAASYFRERASVVIAAAIMVTLRDNRADVGAAADLVQDIDRFRAAMAGRRTALEKDALSILDADPKHRDSIMSSVGQALQFLLDDRLRDAMTDHTIDLVDLTRGDTDLFIVTPADNRRQVTAPYLRWLLSDLFVTIRKNQPASRIVIFIDEAFVLGRFDAILAGVGELPGYGASIWSFWHSSAQIRAAYGDDGAQTIRDTAEALMVFNVPRHNNEDSKRWSAALGSFTGVGISTNSGVDKRNAETRSAVEQQLVTPDQLAALTTHHSITFLNGSRHPTDPIRLRKTMPHSDWRFAGLGQWQKPVGPIDT